MHTVLKPNPLSLSHDLSSSIPRASCREWSVIHLCFLFLLVFLVGYLPSFFFQFFLVCSFFLLLFMLRRSGRGNFCVVEKSRKFSKTLFFGREVLVWFSRVLEECLNSQGKKTSFQMKREGNIVFLFQRCENTFGRFGKLLELGTGKGNVLWPYRKEKMVAVGLLWWRRLKAL